MSDVIFIAATIVFFAICAVYVHWCDTIIGPDDFPSPGDDSAVSLDQSGPAQFAGLAGSGREVTP